MWKFTQHMEKFHALEEESEDACIVSFMLECGTSTFVPLFAQLA